MATTPNATLGSASANTYQTTAALDTYFEGRLNADVWTAASDDAKDQANLSACARLEQEEDRIVGWRLNTTQALSWPRWYPYEDNYATYMITTVRDGTRIAPEWLKAHAELALHLLTLGLDASAPDALAKFSALELPSGLKMTMRPNNAATNDELPPVVQRLIRRFRTGNGGLELVRM